MAKKGLGKGLDSLIPNIYDENFDSNSTPSLEDMLKEEEEEPQIEEIIEDLEPESPEEENEEISEVVEDESTGEEDKPAEEEIPEKEEKDHEETGTSQDLSGDSSSEETVQDEEEIKRQKENVAEVKAIVEKNPRITLWSSRSSAVFRYLRKTEPEFSISKEASILIEEAVSKKYPEIWKLFEEE